jgi:hypothetical protein
VTTFSLPEATLQITGSDSPSKQQWVMRRLRRGEFCGYKSGRVWRMTEGDVAAAIEVLRPRIVPSVPQLSGLTRTSARRLAS